MLHTNRAIASAFFLCQSANDLINLGSSSSFSTEVVLVSFDEEAEVLGSELLDLLGGSGSFSSPLTIFHQSFDLSSDFITILHGR